MTSYYFPQSTTVKQAGSCLWLTQISVFAAGACCTTENTMMMASNSKSFRCDMSQEVQQAGFLSNVAETNFSQNSCCASEKVTAHVRGCGATLSRSDGTAEWRNGGITERRKITQILKDGIAESRNGRKYPQILKDGIAESRNGGKYPQILKDGLTENHPKS